MHSSRFVSWGFLLLAINIPPQFTDEKSNDSSMREWMPLDALNWFGRGNELHTSKSIVRPWRVKSLGFVYGSSFFSPHRVSPFSRGVGLRVLAFRSVYCPCVFCPSQLSLGSTHKTTHELNIDGKLTKVSVRRGQCEGVKTCAAKKCSSSYIVSRS